MNTGFYPDLDTNFEQAYYLCEKTFLHKELIDLLISGNIPQKQIAALRLDCIENENEAKVLLGNLTGCDGKIREAVALKINQLLSSKLVNPDYFNEPELFADATIDINGNICRLVVDSAKLLKDVNGFSEKYVNKILLFINEAYQELDKFIFRDKKYVINKQLFKLYWCLETLKNFFGQVEDSILESILKKAASQNEYTIREKAAELIYISGKFPTIKSQLQNDDNYYVKSIFLNH